MSGGSFDYLCDAVYEIDVLIGKQDQMILMANQLRRLGAEGAAAHAATMALADWLLAVECESRERAIRLRDVWKAVEWWRSGDYGEDKVREALAVFNAELTAAVVGPDEGENE